MLIRGLLQAGAKAACMTLLVIGFGLTVAAPADAASAPMVKPKTTPVASAAAAVKEPETTGSTEKAPQLEPNCAQSRKRLWVEGEGWIVRRVTTCY